MKKDVIEVEPALTMQAYNELNSNAQLSQHDKTPTIDSVVVKSSNANVQSDELDWQLLAECKKYPTESFFVHNSYELRLAKAVCELCVVKKECLEYALENKELYGVWGGTSENERKRIIKRRKTR